MWYIVWTDKALSGWGHARGKSNRCFYGPIENTSVAQEIIRLVRGTRDDWIRWDYTHSPPSDSNRTVISYVDLRGWLSRVAPKRYKSLKAALFMCPSLGQTKSNRRGFKRTVKNPLGATKLTSKEEADLFKAYMKFKHRSRVQNIRVGKRRDERKFTGTGSRQFVYEGRSASWIENGHRVTCSYLSDEGF